MVSYYLSIPCSNFIRKGHHFPHVIVDNRRIAFPGFPLRLEKWKDIFQLGDFEQTEKVKEDSHRILENLGNFRKMLFVIIK